MRFSPAVFVRQKMREIKRHARKGVSLAAVSGGVDSTLSTVLVSKALGVRPLCCYIDVFNRKGETEKVNALFSKLGLDLVVLDDEEYYLEALKGLTGPEEKRKTFKKQYFASLLRLAKLVSAVNLIQGTQARNAKIKTYNSRVDFPISLQVIEPVRGVEKTKIRAVGKYLGLPAECLRKQPFPGPGFVLRISGEITKEKLKLIREITEMVDKHFENDNFFQAFPYLMQEKTVGIRNGKRKEGYSIALRIVDTKDNLNYFVPLVPQTKIASLAKKIIDKFPEVTRVFLDLTPKPPGCVEYQ